METPDSKFGSESRFGVVAWPEVTVGEDTLVELGVVFVVSGVDSGIGLVVLGIVLAVEPLVVLVAPEVVVAPVVDSAVLPEVVPVVPEVVSVEPVVAPTVSFIV